MGAGDGHARSEGQAPVTSCFDALAFFEIEPFLTV